MVSERGKGGKGQEDRYDRTFWESNLQICLGWEVRSQEDSQSLGKRRQDHNSAVALTSPAKITNPRQGG